MSPVLGRTQHTIRSPDGRMLNTVVVSAIMGAIPEIKRYQVRQTGPRDLLILIIPGAGWSPSTEDAIHRGFQERLGNAFRYDILPVDEIRLAQREVPDDPPTDSRGNRYRLLKTGLGPRNRLFYFSGHLNIESLVPVPRCAAPRS